MILLDKKYEAIRIVIVPSDSYYTHFFISHDKKSDGIDFGMTLEEQKEFLKTLLFSLPTESISDILKEESIEQLTRLSMELEEEINSRISPQKVMV